MSHYLRLENLKEQMLSGTFLLGNRFFSHLDTSHPFFTPSTSMCSASLLIPLALPPHILFLSVAEFRTRVGEGRRRREFCAPDWLQIIFLGVHRRPEKRLTTSLPSCYCGANNGWLFRSQ